MPLDYSKFDSLEDSDEEPVCQTETGQKYTGLSKKVLSSLEESTLKLKRKGKCVCYLELSVDLEQLKRHEANILHDHGAAGKALLQQFENNLGRVVLELDQASHAPRLTENFRLLCTGERGIGVGTNKLHYKGRPLSLILPRFCIQVSIPNEFSCWARYLDDEQLHLPSVSFDRPGIVAYGNHGPDTNSCTLMITLNEATHLDGHNQIIGRVIQGMEILRLVEAVPTDRSEKAFIEKNVKTWWGGKPLVDVTVASCGELHEDSDTLAHLFAPAADGDSYPQYPIDFSCTNDYSALFNAAERIREIGNVYFKQSSYEKAISKYRKAQAYLNPLLTVQHKENFTDDEPTSWLVGGLRPKTRTDAVRADFTIKLNICQVLLKQQKWREAILIADGVLLELVGKHSKKGQGALPNDPLTVKALFRRARGRAGLSMREGEMSQFEEAIEDLEQALRVEPGNREVQTELEKIRRLQAQADTKGKKLYQEMLKPVEQ